MERIGEKIYFIVLPDAAITLPSGDTFGFFLPASAVSFIHSEAIKKVALFFKSSVYKTISEIGILCDVKGTQFNDKDSKARLDLMPIARIKTQDRNSLAKVSDYIKCEIVEDNLDEYSKEYIGVCLLEIIDQINNSFENIANSKGEEIENIDGKIIVAYMMFVRQQPLAADLDKKIISLITKMLADPKSSALYQNTLNDFYNHPQKLSVWINNLFNNMLDDELDKARWHILNEQSIITRLEILTDNLVPVICGNINAKFQALSAGQSLVPGGQQDNAAIKEFQDMERKIKNPKMPDEARKEAEKELGRLKRMNSASSEYEVCKTYLDRLLAIPWGIYTKDNLDIAHLRKTLNEDHEGLNQVKDRIIENMAVQILNQNAGGSILCLYGPPGTGKTSIANSIAKSLGRKKISISLGSMRDEAEIKGHRRTYVGALPGKIINGIIRAGTLNPVIILDEIDKLREDFKGDPAAALLEVLDPEQNNAFYDHYFDVPVDLSKVLFITTANITETILPALKDRLEMIAFSTYTEQEKLRIAENFLVPKQIKAKGIINYNIKFSKKTLLSIIRFYVKEAGVRRLEREIATICRKIATEIVEKKLEPNENGITVNCSDIHKYLGSQKFSDTELIKMKPGMSVGLAWTSFGGDILHIEATETINYQEKYMITGLAGEVMKESLRAAITFQLANAEKLFIKTEHFSQEKGIHVHFPVGSIKKDGPSAGLAMSVAIYSEFTGKIVKQDVAFTGEITSKGRVLPVGGLKEKTLAAKRAGINTIYLSKNNFPNIEELESYIKKDVKFVFVEEIQEVLLNEEIFSK